MSSLAQKLLEAANKTDGFEAWALAPIAAEYIQELEARQDELERALEKMVRLFEPGRVYDFREVSALSSEALHIATTALTRASN